jgi:hypothetical protein
MSDPISDQSTYIMWKWLERCYNNHPECRILGSRPGEEERPTLPNRLIEVGSNGDKEVKISLTYGLLANLRHSAIVGRRGRRQIGLRRPATSRNGVKG